MERLWWLYIEGPKPATSSGLTMHIINLRFSARPMRETGGGFGLDYAAGQNSPAKNVHEYHSRRSKKTSQSTEEASE